MFTLGYSFRPWTDPRAIAGGGDILRYVRETATTYGVDRHISYHSRVVRADWSGADACWTVTVEDTETGTTETRSCGFLYLCSGYYSYDEGYTPDWPGLADFAGQVVHPQHWPEDIDLHGKRVVVIGSGATAVTLVPALTDRAEQVTMLQRSPSYVLSLPDRDPIADLLRRLLPERWAHPAVRWKSARMATLVYGWCRNHPARARALLRKGVLKQLPGYDVDTHFNPAYQPWDQRMCLVPNGDFFAALASGDAEVVTDHIEAFTPTGIRLRSGAELEADVVVTATGLNLLPLGGIELSVDGKPVQVSERVAFKGMMLDGVPNLAFALGYTNASWTLKIDLVSSYLARLLRFMRQHGYAAATPRLPAERMATTPFIDMTSGYFQRSRDAMPLQGDRSPWRLQQHYFKDATLFRGRITDQEMEFRRAMSRRQPAPADAAAAGR
jgi:cation diffusion facilitator CzcD-associated flavoprotein CzcO